MLPFLCAWMVLHNMLMCYIPPHTSGENTCLNLLIGAFLFFFFARRLRAYSCFCFRVVVCNKANTLKWQMYPGGVGVRGVDEDEIKATSAGHSSTLTSLSRHCRMSTGQGQSFSGAAVCNIPLRAVNSQI